MTQTMTVNVTYRLSQAGQRAALLAGKPASQEVTEQMICEDPTLLADCHIDQDGNVTLDARRYAPNGVYFSDNQLFFDASPSLAEVVVAWREKKAAIDAKLAQEKQEREAREAQRETEIAAKKIADEPLVDAMLAEWEATPLLDPITMPYSVPTYSSIVSVAGREYYLTPAQRDRATALLARRREAAVQEKARLRAEREAALEAEIAEYGGFRFPVEGGMCAFLDRNLWSGGQSRRWVGVFDQPKGIARFLDSPRGEFTWDVSSLAVGECIQGGGFDTNSRGRRRNETEFFGVVVSRSESEIVIAVCESRAAAIKKAHEK